LYRAEARFDLDGAPLNGNPFYGSIEGCE